MTNFLQQLPFSVSLQSPRVSQTHLAVAIASQLRDEADVILADLDHLFADVVLGAAGY